MKTISLTKISICILMGALVLSRWLQADKLTDLYQKVKESTQSSLGLGPIWVRSHDGTLKQVKPSHIKFMHDFTDDSIKANRNNSKKKPLELPLSNASLSLLLRAFDAFSEPDLFKKLVASLDVNNLYRLVRALYITNAFYVTRALQLIIGEDEYARLLNMCMENEPNICDRAGRYMPWQP